VITNSLAQLIAQRARLSALSLDELKLKLDLSGVEFVQRTTVATTLHRTAANAIVAWGRAHWPQTPSQAAARAALAVAARAPGAAAVVSTPLDDSAVKAVHDAMRNGLPPNGVVGGVALVHIAAACGAKHALVALVASGAPLGLRTAEKVDGDAEADADSGEGTFGGLGSSGGARSRVPCRVRVR
jgi:hypothetical protein